MTVAEDFVAYLRSQATVTGIAGDRIQQAPAQVQLSLPYVVFRRSGRVEELTLAAEGGLVETQLDVECRGATPDESERLADAVHEALNGYIGTWGQRAIPGVFVEDQDDDYQHLPPGGSEAEHTTEMLVRIFSRE